MPFSDVFGHSLWRLHRERPKIDVTTGKEKGRKKNRIARTLPPPEEKEGHIAKPLGGHRLDEYSGRRLYSVLQNYYLLEKIF